MNIWMDSWMNYVLVEDLINGWVDSYKNWRMNLEWVDRRSDSWTDVCKDGWIHSWEKGKKGGKKCPFPPLPYPIPPVTHWLAFLTVVNCEWSPFRGPRVGVWWSEIFVRLSWRCDDWPLKDKQATSGMTGQAVPLWKHRWQPRPHEEGNWRLPQVWEEGTVGTLRRPWAVL